MERKARVDEPRASTEKDTANMFGDPNHGSYIRTLIINRPAKKGFQRVPVSMLDMALASLVFMAAHMDFKLLLILGYHFKG